MKSPDSSFSPRKRLSAKKYKPACRAGKQIISETAPRTTVRIAPPTNCISPLMIPHACDIHAFSPCTGVSGSIGFSAGSFLSGFSLSNSSMTDWAVRQVSSPARDEEVLRVEGILQQRFDLGPRHRPEGLPAELVIPHGFNISSDLERLLSTGGATATVLSSAGVLTILGSTRDHDVRELRLEPGHTCPAGNSGSVKGRRR